jgi:aspartokinase
LQSGARVSPNFKKFRQSSSYKGIASDISADVKKVLATCACIESGFATLNVDSLINEFGRGDSDFNDLVLAELCRRKRFKLVTDDGDFKGKGITVLTANKRLLV